MPWRGHNGLYCHGCDRHRDECGKLSARYLCADCGDERQLEEKRQLRAASGPHFEHWLKRCRAAFGMATVSDAE